MLTRRDLFQAALGMMFLPGSARAEHVPWALGTGGDWAEAIQQDPFGDVTVLHTADLHAQMGPLYHREPRSVPGEILPDTPEDALRGLEAPYRAALATNPALAYGLQQAHWGEVAQDLGPMGGMAHLATVLRTLRAQRPEATLTLDSGDGWQGSYGAQQSQGADMVAMMNALGVDVTTGHWEFTYGPERLKALVSQFAGQFLCGNVRDEVWDEPLFPSTAYFERGGVSIAVIGQAYPYTPIANPRYLVGPWRFGVRAQDLQLQIDQARQRGAALVILVSHNGFALDRALARQLSGLDVILTGHTHDALPLTIREGQCLLVASGSHGKFVGQLDIAMKQGRMAETRFRLIPVLSHQIPADPQVKALVETLQAPYRAVLDQVHGYTRGDLYRQDPVAGTFDDLLCDALRSFHSAEIAFSPGFRWGAALPAGLPITGEVIHSQTALPYEQTLVRRLTGAQIREILEDVADNMFHPDPFYRQGGDMVRSAGLSYRLRPRRPRGQRIEGLTLTRTGQPVDPQRGYRVASWASMQDPTADGPALIAGQPVAEAQWGPVMSDILKQALPHQAIIAPPGRRRDRVVVE